MGKGYNNYMCKKPFHPGSKANIKRAWMAEQKTENEKKKQEELKVQYEKEQDLYNNRALLSTESKDKLELNFMYEAPPGAKRERQKEDDEPEYKFEWQRKYNAPREDYAKGNADIKDQPFGIPVRNVRCIKCHKWGHINTDKECPLFAQASTSSMPTTSMDPMELMRQMREDGYGLKEHVLGHSLNPQAANQQLIPSDESDPEMEFLKSLSASEKKKLLRKLKKLSKKQEKASNCKKKKSKKSRKSKLKDKSSEHKKKKKSKESGSSTDSDSESSSDENTSEKRKKKHKRKKDKVCEKRDVSQVSESDSESDTKRKAKKVKKEETRHKKNNNKEEITSSNTSSSRKKLDPVSNECLPERHSKVSRSHSEHERNKVKSSHKSKSEEFRDSKSVHSSKLSRKRSASHSEGSSSESSQERTSCSLPKKLSDRDKTENRTESRIKDSYGCEKMDKKKHHRGDEGFTSKHGPKSGTKFADLEKQDKANQKSREKLSAHKRSSSESSDERKKRHHSPPKKWSKGDNTEKKNEPSVKCIENSEKVRSKHSKHGESYKSKDTISRHGLKSSTSHENSEKQEKSADQKSRGQKDIHKRFSSESSDERMITHHSLEKKLGNNGNIKIKNECKIKCEKVDVSKHSEDDDYKCKDTISKPESVTSIRLDDSESKHGAANLKLGGKFDLSKESELKTSTDSVIEESIRENSEQEQPESKMKVEDNSDGIKKSNNEQEENKSKNKDNQQSECERKKSESDSCNEQEPKSKNDHKQLQENRDETSSTGVDLKSNRNETDDETKSRQGYKNENIDSKLSSRKEKRVLPLHPDGFSHISPQARIEANYGESEEVYKGEQHDIFRHVNRGMRSPSVKQKYHQ